MRSIGYTLCTGLIGAALLANGCSKEEPKGTTRTTAGEAPPAATAGEPRPADNTGMNERDKSGSMTMPTDQGENATDRDITAVIRKRVVGDDNLSMDAKNVKIITMGQVVTLRGPVKSEAEKKAIADYAGRAPNVKRVDNLLEVESIK